MMISSHKLVPTRTFYYYKNNPHIILTHNLNCYYSFIDFLLIQYYYLYFFHNLLLESDELSIINIFNKAPSSIFINYIYI